TPTTEPSSTPTSKPAATSTMTPTVTATRIAVTVTPRLTKTAAATTAANAPASASASAAIPAAASLSQAVPPAFTAAQIILGEINTTSAGKAGLCDIAIPQVDLIAIAPIYDVTQQCTDVQTGYGPYRQGIERVQATAPKVRRGCQGGGVIDR